MVDQPSKIINEESPLLAVDSPKKHRPNPLPKLQLAIVLLLKVCEPITSQSILPYINQVQPFFLLPRNLIQFSTAHSWTWYHWRGWPQGWILCRTNRWVQVGFCSSIIINYLYQESLFFATEAIAVLQWGRISDHVGRKPVILFGLLGTTLSMLAFGLSHTFGALILR